MHVSSYLEAFLSVYGWMMYNTLYELLAMTWLIFLPFMKLGITTFIDTVADSGNSYAQFKKGLITFLLMVAALVLALVPLDRISFKEAKIDTVCHVMVAQNDSAYLKESFGFDVSKEGGKVPLLPSLVMRIGAGTNSVIYNAMPCVNSVNDFATIIKTAQVEKPELVAELEKFSTECATPARDRLFQFKEKAPVTYGKVLEKFKEEDSAGKKRSYTDEKETHYINSRLYKLMMQPDLGRISGLIHPDEQDAVNQLMQSGTAQGDPLYSAGQITEVASENPDNSKKQQADNSGPASCLKWWEERLYPEIKTSVNNDLTYKVAQTEFYSEKCRPGVKVGGTFGNRDALMVDPTKKVDPAACLAAIQKDFGEEFEDEAVYRAVGNSNQFNQINMRQEDREKANAVGAMGIIGAILSVFTSKADVLASIADNAVSFYAQMFFTRVLLQMLQPMLLMGIFCFWGIYLIIADYRWETILKGLVLIYIITLLPGLWAITQYIDNSLWAALYPDVDSLSVAVRRQNQNYVERLLLDAASTVYNLIFPLILMYLVMEAGGGKPGDAIRPTAGYAQEIGGRGGQVAGRAASGAGRGVGAGIDKAKDWQRNRNANKGLPPGGSKY